MRNYRPSLRWLPWLGLALLTPALGLTSPEAHAQDQAILYACYVPEVGAVYRIKEPGLPQACLDESHVEFSWGVQGPPGPEGPPGPAGETNLAGWSCPTGEFVTGFDASGGILCSGGGVPNPPELCDGTDNDGDGQIDEGLYYCVGGSPAPNTDGNSCLVGWIDQNADPIDGCEQNEDPGEPNDTFTQATALGTVTRSQEIRVSGYLDADDDEDWFTFTVAEGGEDFCGTGEGPRLNVGLTVWNDGNYLMLYDASSGVPTSFGDYESGHRLAWAYFPGTCGVDDTFNTLHVKVKGGTPGYYELLISFTGY